MSLDFSLYAVRRVEVFDANIAHNLGQMAREAGIYKYLWRPDEVGIKTAGDIVSPLSRGIDLMKSDPARFKKFDSPNGRGTYDDFVPWLEQVLKACILNPDAEVFVSR